MATTTEEIPRQAWKPYFEELTDALGTIEATVAVVGRDLGDRFADERQILTDITYDDGDDAIVVGLEAPDSTAERSEHVIEHPQRVLVAIGEPRRWRSRSTSRTTSSTSGSSTSSALPRFRAHRRDQPRASA